jgi:hypothetical protein
VLETDSLQLNTSPLTQTLDFLSVNPLDVTANPVNPVMMPVLPDVTSFYRGDGSSVLIEEQGIVAPAASSSLSTESNLRQTIEAFFAQSNWQNLQFPELPIIHVVPATSLDSQPAVFDFLTGSISISDAFVAQNSGQPSELANLIMNVLTQENSLPGVAGLEQPTESSTLSSAFDQSQIYLKYLFSQPNWTEQVQLALGDSPDEARANEIAQAFLNGDLTLQSLVEVLSSEVLNGTNGVFDTVGNRIYISDAFIHENINNPSAVTTVLLAEFGHYLDAQLNAFDAEGDEGEIFAALVQGYALTEANLAALKAEDDRITLSLNGQEHVVEHSVQSPAGGAAPDLVPITATTFNSDHLYGKGYFPVSWSVGNFGNQMVNGSWTDEVYISNDPFFDSSDYWLWTDNFERYGGTYHSYL